MTKRQRAEYKLGNAMRATILGARNCSKQFNRSQTFLGLLPRIHRWKARLSQQEDRNKWGTVWKMVKKLSGFDDPTPIAEFVKRQ